MWGQLWVCLASKLETKNHGPLRQTALICTEYVIGMQARQMYLEAQTVELLICLHIRVFLSSTDICILYFSAI